MFQAVRRAFRGAVMSLPLRNAAMALDEIDRRIINAMQGDFPICDEPFALIASQLALSDEELLARVQGLLDRGVITRFGPLFQIERLGGAFCLAAMAIPEDDFERVAALVNALPEVAHNYRREHALNMWFVLATETPQGIAELAQRIESACGFPVLCFPKEREFFVDLRLQA